MGLFKLLNAVSAVLFWALLLSVGNLQWAWQPDAMTGEGSAGVGVSITLPAPVVATSQWLFSTSHNVLGQAIAPVHLDKPAMATLQVRALAQQGWQACETFLTESLSTSGGLLHSPLVASLAQEPGMPSNISNTAKNYQ